MNKEELLKLMDKIKKQAVTVVCDVCLRRPATHKVEPLVLCDECDEEE